MLCKKETTIVLPVQPFSLIYKVMHIDPIVKGFYTEDTRSQAFHCH